MPFTTFKTLRACLRADLFRYEGAKGCGGFWRAWINEPGFRFTVLLRCTGFVWQNPWGKYTLYLPLKFMLGRMKSKMGVFIDFTTEIGPGFYLAHPFGIFINRRVVIGANCNVAQHVTLGYKSREPNKGCPVIGDQVWIGPGAVIFGDIKVGSGCAIGANCVLSKSVSNHGVVVGVPGTLISSRGSIDYINYVLDEISLEQSIKS